jgi:RNA polymerase sigma-70 factor (ECF subfamily)
VKSVFFYKKWSVPLIFILSNFYVTFCQFYSYYNHTMHTVKFKKLVREYKNLVYSQALYSSGNRHDAADITQDVLIKLWNNMDGIRLETVKSWLLKVTRNCCIDQSRKKREQCFTDFNVNDEENSFSQTLPAGEPDPEQSLDKTESQQRIIEAVRGLPEKIRTTIILRYIHDEPYDVIARTIGCPLNSIKVYLHRGRKLLAQVLKETE